MKLCLKCRKDIKNCKCEGGFKVIFLYGKPLSERELQEYKNKPILEIKLDQSKYLAERLTEINKGVASDISSINEVFNKIDK